MAILRLALRRETLLPVVALLFATFVCVALVGVWIWRTGNTSYRFLVWNLFLAWVPLFFALLAYLSFEQGAVKRWRVAGFGLSWLLFFPNAPYICTDIIHLTTSFRRNFWADMILILCCAFTGLVVGFVSLYLMHGLVQKSAGKAAGWLFIAAAVSLSGFGVYVGRFLRFNSWDVIYRPLALLQNIGQWVTNPHARPSLVFPVLFATFLFISYLVLYALTHLRVPAGMNASWSAAREAGT